MTISPNPDVVAAMTNEELDAAINVYLNEISKRKQQRQADAIEAFKTAFYNLHKLDVSIYYSDDDRDCHYVPLDNWECFTFN